MWSRHGARPADELNPDNVLIVTSTRTVVLAPGHEARRLGCAACGAAIAGKRVRLVAALSGFICQGCGDHTMAASWFVHDTCMPVSDAVITRLFVNSLKVLTS